MGTFGNAAARSGTALLLALAGIWIAGCSSGGADRPEETGRHPGRTRQAQATGAPTAERACAVRLPGSWRTALDKGRIRPPDEDVREVLTALGPGAAWSVLESTGDRKHALYLARQGGKRRTVDELSVGPADGAAQGKVAAADFDGRWLAYDLVEGPRPRSPWTLYAWNAQTGARKVVAKARRGGAAPGPYAQPVVRSGRLFWAQGVGGGNAAVYAQDLAGDSPRRTVHEGPVTEGVFAAGGRLVWREDTGTGGTRLAAVSLDTLAKAPLPRIVAGLRDVGPVASDGATWAWMDGGALTVWRTGWPKPLALVRGDGRAVAGADRVYVSGDLVTWRSAKAAYALDLRSRSYTRLTPGQGYALASDDAVGVGAVGVGPEASASPGAGVRVTRAAALPALPRCD